MPNIKEDLYILGQSGVKSISKIGDEIRLDLELEPNANLNAGVVFGNVTDLNGDPIGGALVKIMDANYEPMFHAISQSDGTYMFESVPPGKGYNIFAIADGTLLAQETPFDVGLNQEIIQNCTLSPDDTATLGIIAGHIFDDETPSMPVGGALVKLYIKNSNGVEMLSSITYSNEYGQFVFREVSKNNYVIRASALGHINTSSMASINGTGQIISIKLTMQIDPQSANGTVSGMVMDNNNKPIVRAEVFLYEVNSDGTTSPIAHTKTNKSGVYLFINVPQGSYKVMSNKVIDVLVS